MSWENLGLIYLLGDVLVCWIAVGLDWNERQYHPQMQDLIGPFFIIFFGSLWTGLLVVVVLFKLIFDLLSIQYFWLAALCGIIPGLLVGLLIYVGAEHFARRMYERAHKI